MTRDALDRYYTPPALALATVDAVLARTPLGSDAAVLEPSSGGGAFVDALAERGLLSVDTVDIDLGARRGASHHVVDFLLWETERRYSLIIGNPPFGEAQAHITKALSLLEPDGILAFLLPMPFWCSIERAPWWPTHMPSLLSAVRPRPEFRGDGADMQEIALYVWWADELTLSGPKLGHLDWAKPPRAVRRAQDAERAGQLPLLGQGHTVAAQPSLFGGAA